MAVTAGGVEVGIAAVCPAGSDGGEKGVAGTSGIFVEVAVSCDAPSG
jgi:hypothetical protein